MLLAASSAERARASPVAPIYESSAALDALEREAPKRKARQYGKAPPQLAAPSYNHNAGTAA